MKSWFKRAHKAAQATPKRAAVAASPAPMMLALEPRIMFDAAVGATAVDVAHHAEPQPAPPPAHASAPAPEHSEPAPAVVDTPTVSTESPQPSHNVVFVDSRVQESASLLQNLAANTEVVYLQNNEPGLQQIADYLADHADASSIQIVAHGSVGDLWLGNTYLSSDNVAEHAVELSAIGSHMREGADILLYGCNTAAGDKGLAFVGSLAALSGQDVAASDDRTGASGDWDLEIKVGSIEAAPALALPSDDAYAHDLAILTVTTNLDTGADVTFGANLAADTSDGSGLSLREAINWAASSGDTVTFNAGMTVTLAAGQLTLAKSLTIDGDIDNNGSADITIDANYRSGVLSVNAGQTVSLDGLVITKGRVSGTGGNGGFGAAGSMGAGISNAGNLTLQNVSVTVNAASGGGGGGGVSSSFYGGGGGGGGGFGGIGGGHGGSAGPGIGTLGGGSGGAGSGGYGGGYDATHMGGRGGSTTGGAGGVGVSYYSNGGNGATASNGSISIGGGGGGAGWDAVGGSGGNAAGGIYVATTGTLAVIGSSSITNNIGAGGGGGGGGGYGSNASNGGSGGRGVGAIWNRGTVLITAANFASMSGNAGASGAGGAELGVGTTGLSPTAVNLIYNDGGVLNTAYVANAAPVIGNVSGNSVNWAGVGLSVAPDTGANASLTDTELGALNSGNGNWSGGSLAVQRSGTAISADTFGFNTSGALFTVSGSTLQSSGLTFATFTNTSGVLTINFTSSGTAATTALVNDVAQRIDYRNDMPSGDATLRFTLSDGTTNTTADVTVASDTIYVTNTADTATINIANGVSFSEAVAIAAADASGSQTLVISSALAGQTVSTSLASSLGESLTLDLDSASGATLSGGTLSIGSGFSLTATNGSGDTATIATTLSGAGGLIKAGTGTVTLSATNAHTGATTVSAGTLSVATDSNLGSGAVTLAAGSTLALTGASTIDNAIALGGTATVDTSANATLSGNITGAGGLTKAGASTLTFSGTGSHTGATSVNAGSLLVNGALSASSSVTVASGATLGGSGSISSNTTVNSGGTLSPGNSPGTLTLNGNLTMASGSTLAIEINGSTAGSGYDQVVVNGAVDVSGATLSATQAYTAGSGDSYTIIVNDAADSVTGTFTGLAEGATLTAGGNGTVLTASYIGSTGNDLTLTGPLAPAVTSVSSSTVNGTYRIGDTVAVTVTFDAAVFVNTTGGTPSLTLETGTTDRTLNYVSGSGSDTLTFNYTVQAGDLSADLDYTSASALSLNGSTIRNALNFDAVLTLASPGAADSLGANKALVIDGVRPTASIVVADTALAVGETSTVTITFNEAVSGLTTADFTVANGALSGLSSSNGGITWTATLTPTASVTDATNLVTLDNTGLTDTAGNAGSGTTDSNNYAIDTARPTATLVMADTALRVGETSLLTITFSEAVTGFTNADLTIANGTLSAVSTSDSGVTWTATFTPTASLTDATNLITLNNTGVTDAAGNSGSGTTNSNNYAIDTVRPTASIVVADNDLAVGETSGVTITFSEAVTGFTNADLTIANGTLSAVNSINGGVTWTATLTPTASITDATNVITLANTGVADAAGNAGTGTTNSNNYAIDTARPTANIVVADNALSIGETSLVTITFSEAVSGFDNSALTVANGTLSTVSTSDDITFTATFTPTASVTDATNLITLDNTYVADAAGNSGSGTTDSNNYAIDTVRPTASIVVADSNLLTGETSLVTITFSEAVTGFTNADLTIANGTLSAVSSGDGGVTWTATFTPTASLTDATNLITLANTGVADAAGNAGSGTTDSNNYAIATIRPTAGIVVADAALAVGDTSLVTITFSEAVTGFTSADLTIANGTLSAVSSGDGGITWTATLTPTASLTDATNLITLDNTGVVDAASNAGSGTTDSNNYAIDTARPTASIVVADTALAIGETSLVTITFSEAVTGFTNADLTIANGTLSAVSSGDGGITWTASFTPTASVTDATNLITLDNTGVTDAAGNAGSGTTDSNNYAIDTVRPTATVVVADTALSVGETSLVTITFSEAVTGFANADLSIANGTLSAVSSGDGGITWTATLTPTASITDGTNLVTLDNTGVTDAAGNAGSGTTDSNNYAIATLRPTASIVVADTALAIGETSLVTITFSEAVTGFTNADLTVANGTLSAVSSGDGGITWTASFTPTASVMNATNLITLDNTGVTDAAGNAGTGTTDSNNYAIDTVRPTASIVVADSALAVGETSLVTITFSEAVTGFTNADLTIANGTLSAVGTSDGGITWTATLTPTASITDATNLITLGNTGITDAAGNAGIGTTDSNNYAIDSTRPTATIVVADTALAVGETSLVTITFSQAVTAFDNADLTVANGTLSTVSSSDGGITWTATLTPTASLTDPTNLITLDTSGVTDVAGNTGSGTTDSNNYAIDTLRPTASIVVADAALATGETSTVTITFNEAVSGLTTADFTVANAVLSGLSSSDGGINWTATLTPTTSLTDPTNLITLDNTGVQDSGGNAGTGTTDSNNYALDTLRPSASIVMTDSALVSGDSSLVTITFSEAVTGFSNADLTVANGTLSAVSSADGGITWTATFTPSADLTAAINLITLANTGVQDAAGNTGTGSTDSGNYAIDTATPAVTSVAVPADATYVAGDNLDFSVNLSEAVMVDTSGGTPRIAITLDTGGTVYANYLSGSGSSTFVFRAAVSTGQIDSDGITVAASLDLNGGTLRDAAGNDTAIALNGVESTAGVQIDAVAPTVATVSLPADGHYNAGDVLSFTVNTSETITVAGVPQLALDIGGTTVYASYVSGSGSSALLFQYAVQAGDNDADGLVPSSVQSIGGTLRDAAGNNMVLALNGVDATAGVVVDTTDPAATGIVRVDSTPTAAGSVGYTVTFSEAVSGLDVADFALNTTGTASGSITSVTQLDAHTYSVLVTDLEGAGQLGLDLNSAGAGVTDEAGNTLASGLDGERYQLRPNVVVAPPDTPPTAPDLPPSPPPIVTATPALPVTLVPTDPITPITAPTLSFSSPMGIVAVGMGPSGTDAFAPPTIGVPTVTPASARSFIEVGAASGGGLQSAPELGNFSTQPGQAVSISLPSATFTHSERNAQVSVEVRLANGRPLPAWLKFDPVTGTLSGQPPPGLNQKLSIEIVARDSKGNRANSHLNIEVKSAVPRPEAAPPKPRPEPGALLIDPMPFDADLAAALARIQAPEPGRASLAAQFERFGTAARHAERAALLEHARAATLSES
jgi:hypothetical protein